MKSFIIAVVLLVSASPTWASSDSDVISQTILSEYGRLRKLASELKPEFQVGGYLNGKMYGDHKLLWRISEKKGDNEVIRIYREKSGRGQAFVVEYFFSHVIVEGTQVVRRFIGPSLYWSGR